MALDADQIQKVRQTLFTAGWREVIAPAIANRGRNALKSLALSRTERVSAYKGTDFDTDDDVLRAIIRDCEWMISVWTNELAVAEHNRTLDELDRQNSTQDPAGANR